jgi:hypothetical protein
MEREKQAQRRFEQRAINFRIVAVNKLMEENALKDVPIDNLLHLIRAVEKELSERNAQKETGTCETCQGRGNFVDPSTGWPEVCFRCAGTGKVLGREPTAEEIKKAGRFLERRKAKQIF